jgi:hypothetical protein
MPDVLVGLLVIGDALGFEDLFERSGIARGHFVASSMIFISWGVRL